MYIYLTTGIVIIALFSIYFFMKLRYPKSPLKKTGTDVRALNISPLPLRSLPKATVSAEAALCLEKEQEEKEMEKISIVDKDGQAFIEIDFSEPSSDGEKITRKKVSNSQLKLNIWAILKELPLAVLNAKTHNSYRMVFSPAAETALRNGGAELMKSLKEPGMIRAIAQSKSGKILESGSLLRVNTAATPLVIWQALAIVTAQKFLADIDKKLDDIKEGINLILDFLEAEQRGSIEGNVKYVMQIVRSIQSGKLEPDEVNNYIGRLEDVERETLQIMSSLKNTISQKREGLYSLDMKSWYSVSEAKENFIKQFDELIDKYSLYDNCLRLRLITSKVRLALPVKFSGLKSRIQSMKSDFEYLDDFQKESKKKLEEKTKELKATFSFQSTSEKAQNAISEKIDARSREQSTSLEHLSQMFKDLSKKNREINSQNQGGRILELKLNEKGEIEDLYEVKSKNKKS